MADSWLVVACLGLIGLCLIAMTITLVVVARDLHRTLQGMRALVPACEHVARETRRLLAHVNEVFARARQTTRQVEAVILKACDAASGTIEQLDGLKRRAQAFLRGRLGMRNGTRVGPRRSHHR